MTPEHTPGPWSVEAPMEDIGLWIVEDGKQAYEWRAIATCDWPDERGDIPRKQVDANARLIAAAPDLLAACVRFMPNGIAIGNGNVPDDLCVPMDVTMGELRAFEAAIAKATGAA